MILTNVNIDLYKTFVAVYEAEKGTAAGDRLHIGATGISKNIKSLERQLGNVKLFNPHNKGMKPTKLADALYKHIKNAFIEINNGESIIKNFNEITEGHLHIGCHAYIANYVLLDYFIDFSKAYPGVSIKFTNKSKTDMDNMLERHDIDLIIDVVAACKPTDKLAMKQLAQLTNTFYTSKEYAELNGLLEGISKDDLFKHHVLLYAKHHNTMQALQKALERPLTNFYEITTSELMYGLVRKNAGIGYALTKFLDNCLGNEDIIKIKVNEVTMPLSNLAVITNKKDKNPIITKFVNGLIEYCNKNLGAELLKEFFSLPTDHEKEVKNA